MTDTPETIYLIPGEYDGEACLAWCDDPAPGEGMAPADAVEYVRKDVHQEVIDRQSKVAKMGMDAAKKSGAAMYQHGQKMLAESNPEALDSERAMNAQLTGELDRARQVITDLLEYAECNDPRNPHIGSARDFLNGDVK